MLARLLVEFYRSVHCRLHLPGAGLILRAAARWLRGLQCYSYPLPGVGVINLDFRDSSAYGMVNYSMGEFGEAGSIIRSMEHVLTPGAVLWDVGANLGWISAQFAQARYRLASIQAFEPNPAARRPLVSLFAGHPVVKVHPVALGNLNETGTMDVDPGSTGLSSLKRKLGLNHTVQVQIRRADDLQRELNLPLPDFIKIDVEGFEPEVLSGMQRIIEQKRPIIFYEYQFLTNEEILATVPSGYSLLLIMDDGTVTEDFAKRALGHDLILFPTEKRDAFAGMKRYGGRDA